MLLLMARIILILIALIAPTMVSAQLDNFVDTGTAIESTPRFPGAFESVTLDLNAFSIDTQGAGIRWYIDGIEQASDRNNRSITVTTGDVGSSQTVEAIISLSSGTRIPVRHTLTPSRVDLIIEGHTTVPSFYEGRALPSTDSTMRLIALPDFGDGFNPENYAYTWRLNNKVQFGGSLKGQYVTEMTLPLGQEHVVSVDVINADGVTVRQAAVTVPVATPEIHFYEDNPLRGTALNSIGDNLNLLGEEVTVRAEPFYMDNNILNQNYLIEWEVDNQVVQNPNADQMTITLQNGGGLGLFQINFHIRNLDQLLQGAEDGFVLQF